MKLSDYEYYRTELGVLYCGDCLDILPLIDKVDLVLTDPPYGINADREQRKSAESRIKSNGKSKAGRGWKLYDETEWDKEIPKKEIFDLIFDKSRNQIIWGGSYFTEYLKPSMGWLVWDKGQRNFSLADGELAWTSYDRALRIIGLSRASALKDGREHPTQKSLQVIKYCIEWSKEIGLILDPFLGSGTTAVACEKLGRRWMGIEISEKYCEIAKQRIKNEADQFKMEMR